MDPPSDEYKNKKIVVHSPNKWFTGHSKNVCPLFICNWIEYGACIESRPEHTTSESCIKTKVAIDNAKSPLLSFKLYVQFLKFIWGFLPNSTNKFIWFQNRIFGFEINEEFVNFSQTKHKWRMQWQIFSETDFVSNGEQRRVD